MPTRAARWDRRHSKGNSMIESYMGDNEADTLQGAQSCTPQFMHAVRGMPTPLDCAILSDVYPSAQTAPEYEPLEPLPDGVIEVGPIPEGAVPGQTLVFDHMGTSYEVEVPEGHGTGDYFEVTLSNSFADAEEKDSRLAEKDLDFGTDSPEVDGRPNRSDDSTCAGDSASSEAEDPMWNTDWTIERVLTSPKAGLPDSDDLVTSEECCVEEQPDTLLSRIVSDTEQGCGTEPQAETEAEVFNLNDVTTWFTRLQQRREQALRKGKTKLVRKIDLELEKARAQDGQGSQGALGTNVLHEEPAELDGIWDEDWTGLAMTSPRE